MDLPRDPGWAFAAIAAACLAAADAPATAQADAAQQSPARLTVLTKQAEPFVIRGEDGEWSGISIELWRRVAEEIGATTTYGEATLEEMLDSVALGEADAAIAAITITPDREERVDFSHPYHTAGLGIAVNSAGGASAWLNLFRAVVSPQFLQTLGALVAVLLVAGLLVWLFERRSNREQFGGGLVRGIGAGFWWSAVTMTTVGYGDKAPQTLGGRLVALVWMYTSVIIIAAFTGGLASALTVGTLSGKVQGVDDLPNARVGVVEGTIAAESLTEEGISARRYGSLDDALAALDAGRLDAVVHDAPILRWAVRRADSRDVSVLAEEFRRQGYGVALPEGSALREQVNRAILEVVSSPTWSDTVRRYVGR